MTAEIHSGKNITAINLENFRFKMVLKTEIGKVKNKFLKEGLHFLGIFRTHCSQFYMFLGKCMYSSSPQSLPPPNTQTSYRLQKEILI